MAENNRMSIESIGKALMEGYLLAIGKWTLICLVFVALLLAFGDATGLRTRDSTDSPTERSGLKLRTDHGTGCQYLESADGALTPRMNRAGKQVCQ